MSRWHACRRMLAWSATLLLFGCVVKGQVADDVNPLVASHEFAEAELLDVAIEVFTSDELTDEEIAEEGVSDEIRQAEERFIPIHLKYTLQRSGYWGTVRVVPSEDSADIVVHGTIHRSNGGILSLDIMATDARGVKWLQKTYSEEITPRDYANTVPEQNDAFQDLYNSISNDLARERLTLSPDDIGDIQNISELRFAHDMAPNAFTDYFIVDNSGHYVLQRLPFEDDPMLNRVRTVQVRDAMLIDMINNYYDVYYQDLWQPYTDWRRMSNEEATALKKLQDEALTRKLLGLASIVGAVAISSGDSNLSRSNLPAVMVMGGAAAIYSGFQKSEETKIHKDAIEELSQSFASEADPLVVEVIGETVRLTGSAEEQYAKWRTLLHDIYRSETGLPSQPVPNELGTAVNTGDSPPEALPETP